MTLNDARLRLGLGPLAAAAAIEAAATHALARCGTDAAAANLVAHARSLLLDSLDDLPRLDGATHDEDDKSLEGLGIDIVGHPPKMPPLRPLAARFALAVFGPLMLVGSVLADVVFPIEPDPASTPFVFLGGLAMLVTGSAMAIRLRRGLISRHSSTALCFALQGLAMVAFALLARQSAEIAVWPAGEAVLFALLASGCAFWERSVAGVLDDS
ncbi:hypothetical protein ASE70_01960 [Sphingomonas sp. Leaf22]|uniref:hypothetical protein n=1 Tax=Sphingomonas sp. Leaf22 TaxID=1735687 RepID=UPI0006F56E26|nr:hypothetical protein [Sphingomonas sp. Leaf22]KQM90207.1 hypothetical protein ASE70_01960 [Sphingomonas sp. Leaf22]